MKYYIATILLALLVVGCKETQRSISQEVLALAVPYETDTTEKGDTIYFGGYGSSMAYDEREDIFYLLTDRGPNVDGQEPESKMFPFPDFSPTIGKFHWDGDSIVLLEKITLKESNGNPMLGLPNRAGDGVTGEVAYNLDGEIILGDYRGVDSEGLALAADGSFWVSEEYAPLVMHFAPDGVLQKVLSPGDGLPKHLAQRRPNHGMEGLTLSKDGLRLYGIMQSPLYLPDSSTKGKSVNNRIVEIDLQSGATREFIYQMQSPDNVVCEICTLDEHSMLVIERDGKFVKNGSGFKRIYKIDTTDATDVSDITIEMLQDNELAAQSISPVRKSLYLDVVNAIPDYGHDKMEGLAVISDGIIAVVNDDDFGVDDDNNGGFKSKINGAGNVDHAVIYIINAN